MYPKSLLILAVVAMLLLGSFFATIRPESFNTEMKERSGASRYYGNPVETFDTSTATSVEGGASAAYGWPVGMPPVPPVQAPPAHPLHPVQPCISPAPCPGPTPVINAIEVCQNCDITLNKDIDKYVLKSSVPPCPNMANYVRKSDLPACPAQQPCPKCPLCPACPTLSVDPAEIRRNKEIVEDIRQHPQYATLMAHCQRQSVTAPQPMPPMPSAPLDRKSIFERITTREPPTLLANRPIVDVIKEVDHRIEERREKQEAGRRVRSILTDIVKPMPGQVSSENEAANTVRGNPAAYPTWINLNVARG